jgi:hypothetical protein
MLDNNTTHMFTEKKKKKNPSTHFQEKGAEVFLPRGRNGKGLVVNSNPEMEDLARIGSNGVLFLHDSEK